MMFSNSHGKFLVTTSTVDRVVVWYPQYRIDVIAINFFPASKDIRRGIA
jgi:hypothetical protein